MSFVREPPPLSFEVTALSSEEMVMWEPRWDTTTGVTSVNLLLDVQTITLGTAAGIEVKPALQLASVRTDRPSAGGAISTGSWATAAGRTQYAHTLSAITDRFFFRRGVAYKLTAGSVARAQGLLHGSWQNRGLVLAPDEFMVQPNNDSTAFSVFPLGGGKPAPAIGVDKAKSIVIGMGNANTDLEWQLAARVFNDPLARGDWSLIEAGGWRATSTTNFEVNTDEQAFTGLTISGFQWIETGIAVRKGSANDPNSRCQFFATGALTYT